MLQKDRELRKTTSQVPALTQDHGVIRLSASASPCALLFAAHTTDVVSISCFPWSLGGASEARTPLSFKPNPVAVSCLSPATRCAAWVLEDSTCFPWAHAGQERLKLGSCTASAKHRHPEHAAGRGNAIGGLPCAQCTTGSATRGGGAPSADERAMCTCTVYQLTWRACLLH